jgi:hypothetical protein
LPTTICPVPDCRSPFQTAFDVRAGMIVPSVPAGGLGG